MHLFVAIELPPQIKKNFSQLYERLKEIQGLQAIQPNNLFIPLLFKETTKIESLVQKLKELPKIELEIEGFGFYPNPKNPKVLSLTINKTKELDEMIKSINERPFSPRLNIAKLKKTNSEAINIIKDFKKQVFKIETIKLYETKITKFGRINTLIETF